MTTITYTDTSTDADAFLANARAQVRAERAKQARAAAWMCVYFIQECEDSGLIAVWQAERARLEAEAERLEAQS